MNYAPHGTLKTRLQPLAPDSLEARLDNVAEPLRRMDIAPETMWLAHEVVTRQNLNGDDAFNIIVLMVLLLDARAEGSTCLPADPKRGLHPHLKHKLQLIGEGVNPDGILNIIQRTDDPALSKIFAHKDGIAPIIRDENRLYIEQTFRAESALIQSLMARIQLAPLTAHIYPPEAIQHAFDEVLQKVPFQPKPDQKQAILNCISNRFSVVSGGPGTGKTTGVVLNVLRVLVRLGVSPADIAVCAPTGKASKRVSEAMDEGLKQLKSAHAVLDDADIHLKQNRPVPQTIHRMLGYNPGTGKCRYHSGFPYPAKVVIVDEASMIDLHLMSTLLSATTNAQVILIGDPDQLPSVSVGAVFKDILKTTRLQVARATLTTSIRSEGEVLAFAQMVNSPEKWHSPQEADAGEELINAGVSLYRGMPNDRENAATYTGRDLESFLGSWYSQHIDGVHGILGKKEIEELEDGGFSDASQVILEQLFAYLSTARLLCLTQRGLGGAKTANAYLHQQFSSSAKSRNSAFLHGEPVLMLKNNYTLDVYNGDHGVVLYTTRADRERPTKRAIFPKGNCVYKAFDLDAVTDTIEHAYAMTVHKSQGSEFEHVGLILPPEDIPLLTREIVYTGATRAKRSVAIFGAPELLQKAAQTPTYRFSGLMDIVWEEAAKPKDTRKKHGHLPMVLVGPDGEFARGETVRELYENTLQFLVNTGVELNPPYASGHARYLLAREPIHKGGGDFLEPVQVGEFFMEAHKSRRQGVMELLTFLERIHVPVHNQSALKFDRLLELMYTETDDEVFEFAKRLYARVQDHPHLYSDFTATYWDIKIAGVNKMLWRNTHAYGGSISLNEATRGLVRAKGLQPTTQFIHGLAALDPETALNTENPKHPLRLTKLTPYSTLIPHEACLWELIDTFIPPKGN